MITGIIPPAICRAQAAQLAEHYHISPDQLARMTRQQIHLIYRHPRDKDGNLILPIDSRVPALPKKTLEESKRDLRNLAKMVNMPAAKLAEKLRQLEIKYGVSGNQSA